MRAAYPKDVWNFFLSAMIKLNIVMKPKLLIIMLSTFNKYQTKKKNTISTVSLWFSFIIMLVEPN